MSIFSQKQNVTTWRSTSFDSDEKSPASSNFTADAFTKKLGFYGLALMKPGEGRKRKQDQQGGKRDEGKAAAAVGTGAGLCITTHGSEAHDDQKWEAGAWRVRGRKRWLQRTR